MNTETYPIYSFHNEIACYYFKFLQDTVMVGIKSRKELPSEYNLVGFWKIKNKKTWEQL